MSRTVEVRVAGQNYRVVSSAPEGEVRRLADAVNAKLAELFPKGRAAPPNALLLAAIALAHDLEEERERRGSVEERARELLQRVVAGIDDVLGEPTGLRGEAISGRRQLGGPRGEADAGCGEPIAASEDPTSVVEDRDTQPEETLTGEATDTPERPRAGGARKGALEAPPAVREVSRET